MQIKNEYIDERGNVYNIRNVHYESLEKARFNFGAFITESKPGKFDSIVDDLEGIYLYKCKYDFKRALRIYKDYMYYKHVGHFDEKIVSELQLRQKNIKLTEFSTGVVTIENSVIGQEVPYYEDYATLKKIFKNDIIEVNPIQSYIKILNILKELFKEGIVYQDIHSNNFLYRILDEDIKLIDFDRFQVKFDEGKNCNYESMIDNLKYMINLLNSFKGIEFDYGFEKTQTLEEIEESILENQKRLK